MLKIIILPIFLSLAACIGNGGSFGGNARQNDASLAADVPTLSAVSRADNPRIFLRDLGGVRAGQVRRITQAGEGAIARNEYTSIDPENADGRLLLIQDNRRANSFRSVISRAQGTVVLALPASLVPWNADVTWSDDPNQLIYLRAGNTDSRGDLSVRWLDVRSGKVSRRLDLSAQLRAKFPSAASIGTRSKLRLSHQNTIAVHVRDSSQRILGFALINLGDGRLEASFSNPWFGQGVTQRGDILLSHTGNYLEFNLCAAVSAQGTGNQCQGRITDRQFRPTRQRALVHPAFAVGRDGNEYLVGYDADSGDVLAVGLNTNKDQVLMNVYSIVPSVPEVTSAHFSSAKNAAGIVVASFFRTFIPADPSNSLSGHPYKNKVIVFEVGGSARRVTIADSKTCTDSNFWRYADYNQSYFVSPFATPNRDGTRVFFGSDNGRCGGLGASQYEVSIDG